jgi:ribosome-binding factor A
VGFGGVAMSRRTERIAEQIQSELASVLRAQAADPRIGLITITRVDVAPDLSHALVFWSALASDDEDELARIETGLDSAAPFLRRQLARALPLRRMPELRFRFDPSLALGSRTLRVLKEIEDDEPA